MISDRLILAYYERLWFPISVSVFCHLLSVSFLFLPFQHRRTVSTSIHIDTTTPITLNYTRCAQSTDLPVLLVPSPLSILSRGPKMTRSNPPVQFLYLPQFHSIHWIPFTWQKWKSLVVEWQMNSSLTLKPCIIATHIQRQRRRRLWGEGSNCRLICSLFKWYSGSCLTVHFSEVKSVSVWFQNKRQTERKARRLSSSTEALSDSVTEFSALKCVSSPSKNNTLGKRPRSHCNPISHQHHVGTQENLLSVTNHDITREVGHTRIHISTPLSTISSRNNMAVASHELWKHILSSSPSASDDSLRASSDFGSVERLANSAADIHIGEIGFPVDSDEKRSRILEWACNREMKRKRGGRHGSAKTSALRLNQGLGFDEGHCCASPYCCRPEFESALSLLSLPGSSALIASPSEDVIHAASLLLCLKHSIRRPKSFDRAEFNNWSPPLLSTIWFVAPTVKHDLIIRHLYCYDRYTNG